MTGSTPRAEDGASGTASPAETGVPTTEFPYRITFFSEERDIPSGVTREGHKWVGIGTPTGMIEVVKHDFKDGSYTVVALCNSPEAAKAAARVLQWSGRTPEMIKADLDRCFPTVES